MFALHSIVNVEIPLQTTHVESRMYEMLVQEVEVENPFSGDCDFTVSLTPFEHTEPEKKDAKGARSIVAAASKRTSAAAADDHDDKEHGKKKGAASIFPPAFGCDRSRLRLRRGEKTTVQVSFLPFYVGHQYARLRFEDNAFGPFVYELHGESTQPAHTGPVKTPVDARASSIKEIALPFLNPLLEAAKKAYNERHPGSKDKANQELVKALGTRVEEILYNVEVQSPYISTPAVVVLASAADAKTRGRHSASGQRGGGSAAQQHAKGAAGAAAGNAGAENAEGAAAGKTVPSNVLSLTLNPSRGVGVYNARVVLTSEMDIRCGL